MFAPRMFSATLVALLVVSASPARTANERRLAIVELVTPPNMVGLGSQISRMLVDEARKQHYQVLPPDQARARLNEKARVEIPACEGAPTCIVQKLAGLPASRAVVGSLDRDERSYLLKLWLVDLRAGKVLAKVDRAILIASRRLMTDAEEALPAFLRGEREPHGTLVLTATVPEAKVTVDGEAAGVAPVTVTVKPGVHSVRVQKRSYFPVERLVTVEAGQKTEEQFRLLQEPGEGPPQLSLPQRQSMRVVSNRKVETLRVPVGAWVTFGAAAVALGGGAYFGSHSVAIQTELQGSYHADRDYYGVTRARALEGQRSAVIANALFGATGALLVGGVVLTAIENAHPAPVQVSAGLAGGGGGVLVQGSF